jgi:hypothetical protein
MVVLSHGPDTCAAAHPELAELAQTGFAGLRTVAQKHQVAVQGAWVDTLGHAFYILADAPNAHAINAVMTELKFFHWNTGAIHPVIPAEEAARSLADR